MNDYHTEKKMSIKHSQISIQMCNDKTSKTIFIRWTFGHTFRLRTTYMIQENQRFYSFVCLYIYIRCN